MRKMQRKDSRYVVYILGCADKTLYIGITNDLERRLIQHNTGKTGAHYTKTRRPVILKYSEISASRSDALKREYVLKQMTRADKLALIKAKKIKLMKKAEKKNKTEGVI